MKSKYIEFPEKGIVKVKEEEVETKDLNLMEVVIENEASIISTGTELARLNALEAGMEFPLRPGYGSIGRITAKGEGIDDFEVGDRVFYAGIHASVQRFDHGQNHQWAYLFPVPEDIDPTEATLACMAQIAMTAPNVSDIKLGDTVAVYGLGMIGILAGIMYKEMGAYVIGLDPLTERCELAESVGFDATIDAVPDKQVEEILAATDQKGAEVTVDAVGHSAVINNCIDSTADFGQIILVGSPRASYTGDQTSAYSRIHMKGLVVKGAHMWRYPVDAQRGCQMDVAWTYKVVFDLIKSGKIDASKLISHIISPEEAPAAYKGLEENANEYKCVVIDWR
jgi:2-desacetyl-2-hydroxyethyl bacteriochlorophyllide A dehydrogenase